MTKFLGLALILAAGTLAGSIEIGCAMKTKAILPESNRKTLVLIHGSHFDAGLWSVIEPDLKSDADYDVFPLTLLGRTDDERANLTEIAQDACAKIVGPAMIVAHSFGGAVVNQMAGICPAKIERIIYVAALVPLKDEKAFGMTGPKEQQVYERAVTFEKTRITPKVPSVFLKVMDATIDPKNLPKVKLFTESYKPGQDVIAYDNLVFEKIPKYYIYTAKDKILGPELQKKFTTRLPMIKTDTVASGHLPMLSKPKELALAIRKML